MSRAKYARSETDRDSLRNATINIFQGSDSRDRYYVYASVTSVVTYDNSLVYVEELSYKLGPKHITWHSDIWRS